MVTPYSPSGMINLIQTAFDGNSWDAYKNTQSPMIIMIDHLSFIHKSPVGYGMMLRPWFMWTSFKYGENIVAIIVSGLLLPEQIQEYCSLVS